MEHRKYTKIDFGRLIQSDWSHFEGYLRIDDNGIWLFEENAPELQGLSESERDILLDHPERNANRPVLPFPFTIDEFLAAAHHPLLGLEDFYVIPGNPNGGADLAAIERLKRMHLPPISASSRLKAGTRCSLREMNFWGSRRRWTMHDNLFPIRGMNCCMTCMGSGCPRKCDERS